MGSGNALNFFVNFFTSLALLTDVLVAIGLLVGLAALTVPQTRPMFGRMIKSMGYIAYPTAMLISLVVVLGSLYFSQIAKFTPCELCWYQRIALYPLLPILIIGWFRRDRKLWMYAAPFLVVAPFISTYHWLVEHVDFFTKGASCDISVPCSVPYFQKYGFVTLSWMALSAALGITTLLIIDYIWSKSLPEEDVQV